MSRRTKFLLAALFLVLLAVPAIYIPLSWSPPQPFEVRYLGQGAPVMHSVDPSLYEEMLCVPVQVEVRNTQPCPIHLRELRIIGDIMTSHPPRDIHLGLYRVVTGSPGRPLLLVERSVPPIPAHGSMRMEMLIPQFALQQADPASLHVTYESISTTKKYGQKFCYWMNGICWRLFSCEVCKAPEVDRHTATLRDAAGQPPSLAP